MSDWIDTKILNEDNDIDQERTWWTRFSFRLEDMDWFEENDQISCYVKLRTMKTIVVVQKTFDEIVVLRDNYLTFTQLNVISLN